MTVIDFLLQLIVGLFSAYFCSPSSKGVELDVTRVNSFNVALLRLSGGMFVKVVGLVDHVHDEIVRVGLKGALEVTDRLIQEGQVSKDLDRAQIGRSLHISMLSSESLRRNIGSLCVQHPADGEEIGKAGVERLLVNFSLRATVSTIGGLSSI